MDSSARSKCSTPAIQMKSPLPSCAHIPMPEARLLVAQSPESSKVFDRAMGDGLAKVGTAPGVNDRNPVDGVHKTTH
jgi:hypothetical protein